MMNAGQAMATAGAVPARGARVREWQLWAPYAAFGWSLAYAALGVFWAFGGQGFPYAAEPAFGSIGPLLGRFGPGVAWIPVMVAGIPAAAVGAAMLRGVRGPALRPLFIAAGTLLAGVLLLLMTGLDLLVLFGYIPYIVSGLITGGRIGQKFLANLTEWTVVHEILCLIGGFLWLAATVSYARRSGHACPHCGRRETPGGWQTPSRAARWGRIAVYVSMLAPVFYAFTRYAWAFGFPLGMTAERLRDGQEKGLWTSGLFLANFGLVGALLTLGLVQRWGETFPRWMIGLSGRRVPIPLAMVPASFVSVLLAVGGIVLWSGMGQMVPRLVARGVTGMALIGELTFVLGPVLLFPLWGVALAVATVGYFYRRRAQCGVCGRGSHDGTATAATKSTGNVAQLVGACR